MDIRKWIAWIIGIVFWVIIVIVTDVMFAIIKIPTYINFGEIIHIGGRHGHEISSVQPIPVSAVGILGIIISARLGMAFYKKNINGDVSEEGNILCFAWCIGLLLIAIVSSIVIVLFGINRTTGYINLALVVLTGYLGKKWFDKKKEKLRQRKRSRSNP